MTGKFYDRIKRTNVNVALDTTTEGDKNFYKQLFAELTAKGVISPLTGLRELGIKEPVRIAGEINAWIAQKSKAEAYAQAIQGNPYLERAIDEVIETNQKLTGGNTQG